MTDNSFRFGVFSSVSSDEQVEDKDSLANQIMICREYGERLGGVETAGPFIADGFSRTFYEGLSEAMADIPALREAIYAADRNEYDVLFIRYFDRLGVLAQMVFTRLSKTKKQLTSVQEAVPITPPSIYDPTRNDSTPTMISIAAIKQSHRINRIINNLKENMPKRIRDGLHPNRTPRGYKRTDKKTPAEQDPAYVAKLLQARDMLMRGESYTDISVVLGINKTSVSRMLSNPFYAGIVAYGKTNIQRLGTKRMVVPIPKSKWLIGKGKHTPIFTQAEYEEILAEIERRDEIGRRRHSTFIFAGILRCAVCGGMVRRNNFRGKDVIVCRSGGVKHVVHAYSHFFAMAARAIQQTMEKIESGEWEETEDKSELIRKALEEIKKRRKNVHEGIEFGSYSQAEGLKRIKELEVEEERLHRDLERSITERVNRREIAEGMKSIDVSDVPAWLATEEPLYINRLLVAWFKEIRVGDTIKIIPR